MKTTIQSATIENYRGLSNVTVEGIGQVNIVVGRNGAGKTSLLEALALACLGNQPEQLLWICLSRGVVLNRGSVEALYGRREAPVSITLRTSKGDYGLTIEPPHANGVDIPTNASGPEAVRHLMDIKLKNWHPTESGKPQHHDYLLQLTPQRLTVGRKERCGECIQASYLPCRVVSPTAMRSLVSRLTVKGQEMSLVDVLKICDDRVRDIRLLDDDIQVELALGLRLPLASLGDGANRLALMADGLLNDETSVVLLDEVDSGLHHSVMESFWDHVITLMEKRPFQLFCTTHDEEMLEATLEPFRRREKTDWLRKMAVTRHGDGSVGVVTSGYEDLRYQIENEYPTRT